MCNLSASHLNLTGDHEASNTEMVRDWATTVVEEVKETMHLSLPNAAEELRRKFGLPLGELPAVLAVRLQLVMTARERNIKCNYTHAHCLLPACFYCIWFIFLCTFGARLRTTFQPNHSQKVRAHCKAPTVLLQPIPGQHATAAQQQQAPQVGVKNDRQLDAFQNLDLYMPPESKLKEQPESAEKRQARMAGKNGDDGQH